MLIQDQETAGLMETKFELMLNMSYQKSKKEIDALRQQLEILSQEIEALKRNSARAAVRVEQQTTLAQSEAPPTVREIVQESPRHSQSQQTQPRSRTGNYTEEDVAIDKMFYFGGKR